MDDSEFDRALVAAAFRLAGEQGWSRMTIAEAARQLFPVVEPPDDLWKHIESAIKDEASVPDPDEEEDKKS